MVEILPTKSYVHSSSAPHWFDLVIHASYDLYITVHHDEQCPRDTVMCSDGKCLDYLLPSFNASCDYTPDCTDGEDERDCGT